MLLFLHVASVILWLGSAATEIVLEITLWRAKTAAKQRALIELHKTTDLFLEGPALLLALFTGLGLMWKKGYFVETTKWPTWFEDKLICVACVLVANLFCIGFVLLRAKSVEDLSTSGRSFAPLEVHRVRRWHLAITSTLFAAPFAVIALWLAVAH